MSSFALTVNLKYVLSTKSYTFHKEQRERIKFHPEPSFIIVHVKEGKFNDERNCASSLDKINGTHTIFH